MPITLTVGGTKTKFANEAVEAAFAQAIAETPERGEVLASLASAAVSKVATALGLAETVWVENGNGASTKRVAFPVAVVERVAAILGCDDLAGAFRHDPAAIALAEQERRIQEAEDRAAHAEWIAERERIGHRHAVVFESGSFGFAPWVALITGTDPTYRLKREFEAPTGKHKKELVYHLVTDGIYEVGFRGIVNGHSYFFELKDGVETQIGWSEVEARFPR